jgi:hypothetical protein
MKYKNLELASFPPMENSSAVGNVTELSYINQIGDQDAAQGYQPMTYES